jgi:hypothetical protein
MMTEQILELLKQATYDVLGVEQVDQQLFAELIVAECIDTIRQNMEYAKVESIQHDTTEFKTILEKSGHFFINELEQHFRVKE